MTAMLPAHLSQSLDSLGDAAAALTAEVREDRADRRRQDRRMMALLAVAVLLLGGLLTLVVQFDADRRERSAAFAEILRQNARTSELIADCTTEGGDCYAKGQARGQDAVRGAIRGYIAVAQCQRVTDTDAELERCVMRRLAATPAPTPSPSGTR